MRIRIDNGQVWTGKALEQASLFMEDGKIQSVGPTGRAGESSPDRVVDAAGQWILPGGVDLHTHISDGVETFTPGTACAAAGGITTLFDMAPFHACVTPEQFQQKVAQAERECLVDFGLIAGIVVEPSDLDHLEELKELGASSFKVFQPGEPPVTPAVVWEAVQAAARTGLRLALHAEEPGCCSNPAGDHSPLAFAHSRPPVAEISAVASVLEMARAAGAPVHICHVSTARSVELIDRARAGGVDVTAEVAPHYLLFDETAFIGQGPRVKTTPPLRSLADQCALWQALADGVIDALACDHYIENLKPAPRDPALIEKAAAGIAGLELSLPLILSLGVQAGRISLERFVSAAAGRPARIAGVSARKGCLAPGKDADFFFYDPQAAWKAASLGDFSRIDTTPFEGFSLNGRVTQTWVRGCQVWDGHTLTQPAGFGRWIPSRS